MSTVTGNLNLVKQGYSDVTDVCAERSLQFQVRFTDTEELLKAIKIVSSYNDFSGKGVARAVERIQDKILWADFGREYSPVLYITAKCSGDVSAIREALKATRPDEVSEDGNRIRFWWD